MAGVATPPRYYHPSLGQVQVHITPTGTDPDGQVQDTLRLMARYIREDSRDRILMDLARRLSTPERIWAWVRQAIRFQHDQEILPQAPDGSPVVEVLVRPVDMLTVIGQHQAGESVRPVGDCDDFTMLVGALLMAAGWPVWLEIVGVNRDRPGRLGHIYVVTRVNGQDLALDASHGPAAGWRVQTGVNRRERVEITSPAQAGTGGMGMVMRGQTVVVSGPGRGMGSVGSVDDDINWAISQGAARSASPWWGVLNRSLDITGGILTSRLGVPPAGTVITTPGGQVIRQAEGYPVPAVAAGTNVAGGSVILLAAAGVMALLLLRR